MHNQTAQDFLRQGIATEIDVLHPDYCPICHKHMEPTEEAAFLSGVATESRWLQKVYRCRNRKCGAIFLANYQGVGNFNSISKKNDWYEFKSVQPGTPIPPDVPDAVRKISKRFVKIYEQADDAEFRGLSEICGSGYRKALEVLIKDYLIGKSNSLGVTEDAIKEMWLGECIEKYVNDPMTKAVAKRAAWLGNDEAHYSRKWVDKDLEDLKKLIRIVINGIDSEVAAGEYILSMNPDKKS